MERRTERKMPAWNGKSPKDTLLLLSDIFFVLILCFVVLFTTLVVTKFIELNDYMVNGYMISVPLLAATAASIGGFVYFLLKVSLRGYREMEDAWEKQKKEGGMKARLDGE